MVDKKHFYIYEYICKKTKTPFYVGKGTSDRKYAHMRAARKGSERALCVNIRNLEFEKGVEIITVSENLTEWEAFQHECHLIEKLGRADLGKGPLLNKSFGGEGISGGIDMYGYRKQGIARKITDMVHHGMLIQDMPQEIRKYVEENKMNVKWVESRMIPHIQEMGNVGYHYKGPQKTLLGWQFSLNRKMIDVNELSLDTRGFLKVHGDLPINKGFVSPAPKNYNFGY
jgi:hypothetical protein